MRSADALYWCKGCRTTFSTLLAEHLRMHGFQGSLAKIHSLINAEVCFIFLLCVGPAIVADSAGIDPAISPPNREPSSGQLKILERATQRADASSTEWSSTTTPHAASSSQLA
jgi:hypothetical protein